MPSRLLVAEGRIGSLVFYLTPQLRAGLTADRIEQWSLDELPPLRPGDVIALPKRKIARLRAYHYFDDTPYESVGPYRLYQITKPPPVIAPGGP